jgi:hypothetical protein
MITPLRVRKSMMAVEADVERDNSLDLLPLTIVLAQIFLSVWPCEHMAQAPTGPWKITEQGKVFQSLTAEVGLGI